jgi:hypothetical protein
LKRLAGNCITGTTWEDYYRYDKEQLGNGNVVPTVSKLLFRESGVAATGNLGNGFLVDDVSLLSSDQPESNGHHKGRHNGHHNGHHKGHHNGHHKGHHNGHHNGHHKGHHNGHH